ncbi:MAG: hypothetical protein HRT37_00145 [Alteromonadaceae bacterium]|nr:hypothetical protein [Alteromonadaceae bacterium]
MAVINCPGCREKISDKSKLCSFCHIDLTELDVDKMQSLRTVNLIKKSQSLMTQSFIAMLLFCGGFLIMFWESVQIGTWQHTAAMGSIGIGFVMYLITRVRLLLLKKSKG